MVPRVRHVGTCRVIHPRRENCRKIWRHLSSPAKSKHMRLHQRSKHDDAVEIRLLDLIRSLAVELHPRRADTLEIGLDASLQRDAGLDSLGRVEMITRIEKEFDVALSEQVFAEAETPRDLLEAIARSGEQNLVFTADRTSELRLGRVEAAPENAQTLIEVLDWHAQQHPDRPHIQFYRDDGRGEIITYGKLREGATAVAHGLQRQGLEVGAAVALMLPTSADYFFSFFGVLLAGGVPVPIYPPLRPSQLEDHLRRQGGILNNCHARILITVPEARRLAQLIKPLVETLDAVVTVADLNASVGNLQRVPRAATDLAFLQYTSGSTGNPKGVMLTHANLLANIRADGHAIDAGPDDVFVSWLPLYHDMGLIGAWLGSLYFAVLLVIMSPVAFLTRPQRWLWALHHHRATLSAAPNFAYELCLNKIDDADLDGLDLSRWRIAFNGAEAVSPDSVIRFCERFGRFGFQAGAMFPVYGLAECSLGLCFPPTARGPKIDAIERERFLLDGEAVAVAEPSQRTLRFVSCGYPLPGHEVRIVDANHRELPERRRGVLQFRGPSATEGYFNNPDGTRRLFDSDWLDSGDLAYVAEGEIYITGRIKDLIIRAGRNIYPDELEGAVGDLPGIRKGRVAVFASEDARSATERLVVLAETRERDPEARKALIAEIDALAIDMTDGPPDDVVLAPPDTVLKTSSGKIRRSACRELYEQGHLGKRHRAVWWQLLRLGFAGLRPRLRRLRRGSGELVYAGYAWLLLYLLSAVTFVLVLSIPSRRGRWAALRGTARALSRASAVPLSVHGRDNLLPADKPCIYVSNHASYLDAYVVVAALPRRFSFLAKAELGRNPLMRLFLLRIEAEFIERFDIAKGLADAERTAASARAGRSLMVFAEGTFTRMPGLLPFHLGAFVTAVEAGLPIVPLAIRGSRSCLRPDSWFPRRGKIAVTVGKPIAPDPRASDKWAEALRLRDATRAFILEHCGEPDLAHESSPI